VSFTKFLEARGLAESTIKRYDQLVSDFTKFCKGKPSLEKVRNYLAMLREKGYKGNYLRFAFYGLKTYFEFLKRPFLDKHDLPKTNEPERPYLKPDEMNKLLEVSKHNLRDHLIIRLATILGCRRIELEKLQIEDIDLKEGTIKVRTAKHGKTRTRLLDDETIKLLKEYLKNRKRGSLFGLSPRELSRIFEKYSKIARIWRKGIGFHSLRRGLTTALHKRGMSTKELQELLGWKSIVMPSIYIQLEPLEVDEKAKKLHPLFGEK